ncbi:MAG TPA: proton-conducting transporter membrane subunit [Planctomycetaceae bacterium]|jgi:NADH:ubiquinone oxidoreductase subunit 5 (subunit L)/multisubunit Na+/H+ antiporter MnhA subunit|nr:proton-conducting transporter membrane subunit [Planctomycetaceae bacterium]
MDILHAALVFGTVLSPLIAAGAIAATGLSERPRIRLAQRLAQLGAVASACCALGLLIRYFGAQVSNESPLSLGRWFINGPSDLLRVNFGVRFDALTAGLAAVLALSTAWLFTVGRSQESEASDPRWLPLGASLLLFASIGLTASTNLAELFVFWEIGTAGAYVLSSLSAKNAQQTVAARKLALVLSVADAFLLCAVFILAAVFGTLDFRILFGRPEVWARAAEQRAGLVVLIGLCILGSAVARCGLIPFLGWIGDLAGRRAPLAALIQAITLLPCGAMLLVRCFPLLNSAAAILPLAAFVGGSSAFCLGVCAVADVNFRRAAGFACASVLGTALLGLSTGGTLSPTIVLGMILVFVPCATAVLLAGGSRANTAAYRWTAVAIGILFSGICGQAWLLGSALESLFNGPGRDTPPLLLAVLLAACGQYLAAASVVRALGLFGRGVEIPQTNPFETSSAGSIVESPTRADSSSGRLMVLAGVAVAAGLVAGMLNFRDLPAGPTGSTLAYAALGLIPGLGGLIAGARSARAEWKVFPGEAVNDLLMRLGKSGFYFDAFLFLFVLVPLRGVAGLARFVDWGIIDTLASGSPASLFESAAAFFAPLQQRGVFFYLFSAMLGTLVLSVLMVWLH